MENKNIKVIGYRDLEQVMIETGLNLENQYPIIERDNLLTEELKEILWEINFDVLRGN